MEPGIRPVCTCSHSADAHTAPDVAVLVECAVCGCLRYTPVEAAERTAALGTTCEHTPPHQLWYPVAGPSVPLCKLTDDRLVAAGNVMSALAEDVPAHADGE